MSFQSYQPRLLPYDIGFQDKFKGTLLHSSQHKKAHDHAGKKVAIIGACTSGVLGRSIDVSLILTAF